MVDGCLQLAQLYPVGCYRGLQSTLIRLRYLQLLGVLLHRNAGRLLLHFQLGNALAHRLKTTVYLHAALITGTQFLAQVIVFAATRSQQSFALQLQGQRFLQTIGTYRISGRGNRLLRLLHFVAQALLLRLRDLQAAL